MTKDRWVRTVCRLYPADFRALLEEDVVHRFGEERSRIARRRGGLVGRLWAVRTLAGLAVGALAEHVRARRRSAGCEHTQQREGIMNWDGWTGDVRFAARSLLLRSPGYTAIAVATIALGVGANTTVFSVVDGVLLRPLPYPDAHELVQVWERTEGGVENAVTGANFADWKLRTNSFEYLVARTHPGYGGRTTVLVGEEPHRVQASGVTEGFFAMMDVEPARGRGFTPEDHRPDGPEVVVVSHAFWEGVLGAPDDLAARPLRIGNSPRTVVGVMPAGFDFPDRAALWLPRPPDTSPSRSSHNWMVNGRLRDGVTPEEASAELATVTAALRDEYGSEMTSTSAVARPLRDELYGDMARPLGLLLGAAGFVLLVACTNLASTMLARGRRRATELAVRNALGASRTRLVRHLLTESLLLAAAGAVAGALVARPLLSALVRMGPPQLVDRVTLDLRVLAVTFMAGTFTVLVFSLFPALSATRTGPAGALRSGGRGGSERGRGAWDLLVGFEVALALVLLAGSAVLIRSFAGILSVETGFDTERTLSVELSLPSSRYADDEALAVGFAAILDNVRGTPGVEAAGLVNHVPLGGLAFNGGFQREAGDPGPEQASVDYRVVTPGYFEAMGIPILEGRGLLPEDGASGRDVAVLSRSAAERFWPDDSPVGRRIRNLSNDSWIYPDRWITIVGVVGDVRHRSLTAPPSPAVYVHAMQRPARASSPTLVARVRGRPADAVPALREAIRAVDTAIPTTFVPMAQRVSESVTDRRFVLVVLGSFSLVALLLAAVGIYGVVSWAVAHRTREVGIRLALGADVREVLTMVMGASLRTVLLGAALGGVGALALSRLLAGMVYEVAPTDPLSFGAAGLVLVGVGVVASLIPGLRATRVDAVRAMRAE